MNETSTHHRTVERLPWLVNGTLDAEERREVEEHLAACADCRRELAATREAFALYAAHLPPEVLVAVAEAPDAEGWLVGEEGAGPVADRTAVLAHLDHCEECRGELALLRESLGALQDGRQEDGRSPAAAPPGESAEVEAAAGGVLPFARPSEPAPPAARPWRSLALAASLLLALVTGAGWWLTSQQVDHQRAETAVLEERLTELRRALDAAAADAGPAPATGVDTAEVEAMERQVAELESRLAELEDTLGGEREQVADLRRELAASGAFEAGDVLLVEDVLQDVVRGDAMEGGAPGSGTPVEAGADRRLILFRVALEGEAATKNAVPYRVVDGAGTVLDQGELTPRTPRDAFASPYLLLPLATAALPSGTLELQLLDGDRVIKVLSFQVP